MINLYPALRKILFLFNAETAHELSLSTLSWLDRFCLLDLVLFFLGVRERNGKKDVSVKVMGLTFPNPVGLAAGLDKNARHVRALEKCGFGFIEVGTVTPLPQPGNDRPRMFRLEPDQAIINRMGFNNNGVDQLVENVRRYRQKSGKTLIGINIGKNKVTPLENAVDDYLICLKKVYDVADYVTINISSPNTPGLRALQHGEGLKNLLEQLKKQQLELSGKTGKNVPLLVKIAPDLDDSDLKEIVQTLTETNVDGVIATNTTNARPDSLRDRHARETGGLSGKPLTSTSDAILTRLVQLLDGRLPVIAVGGIMTPADARHKLELGASLVQVYSGFIYAGPAVISGIIDMLDK